MSFRLFDDLFGEWERPGWDGMCMIHASNGDEE